MGLQLIRFYCVYGHGGLQFVAEAVQGFSLRL